MSAPMRQELVLASVATEPMLRDYQSDSIAAVRTSFATGHRAPLLVMPTAAGKTIVFRETARRAQLKGTRTLVVVHRRELVRQASAKLSDAGVAHGIIAAGFQPTPDATVQVASIQSADSPRHRRVRLHHLRRGPPCCGLNLAEGACRTA